MTNVQGYVVCPTYSVGNLKFHALFLSTRKIVFSELYYSACLTITAAEETALEMTDTFHIVH